jgi:DNA-directed RNA polymerase specialized sigma24 family protein
MKIRIGSNNKTQKAVLSKAQAAADIGDAKEMFIELAQSSLLEGFERQFASRYRNLVVEDIHDVIGSSTDEIYARVSKGEKITAIHSYLWKIIDRRLSKLQKQRQLYSMKDVDLIEGWSSSTKSDQERQAVDKQRDEIIAIAERLIPRLGLTNAQNVMKYVFGAIKNGAQDIPSQEIGDALGLTPNHVRQCLKRGFDRLTRIFKEDHLIPQSYEFPFQGEMEYYTDEASDDEIESNARQEE